MTWVVTQVTLSRVTGIVQHIRRHRGRFTTPRNMTESDKIRLWCWVLGDTPNQIFEVSIERSATIYGLKKAIQALKPSFKDISADSLELFKVVEWY